MRPKRIITIVQARMGSSRLPGKVLMDIAGEPMLERVVQRIRPFHSDLVVVATSTGLGDDAVAQFCKDRGYTCFRGSEEDVLSRFYHAAHYHQADAVVRITADCPLIDFQVSNEVIDRFCELYPDIDYVSNTLPPTYPRGLDTEIMTIAALRQEWRTATRLREHVTAGIRSNPDKYRIDNVVNDHDHAYMRWCVDTEQDIEFMRRVYGELKLKTHFSWLGVLVILDQHQDWIIKDEQEAPK